MNQNLKYPQAARKENATYGKLYVEFVINADGSIEDESVRVVPASEVLKSGSLSADIISDKACEDEAVRVLRACPDWSPAMKKNAQVRQKLVIPIIFKQ
jgi:protein TonB